MTQLPGLDHQLGEDIDALRDAVHVRRQNDRLASTARPAPAR